MIHYRTDSEIELLRKAALLVGKTLGEVGKHIRPGIRTIELDKIAEEFIRDHGAIPAFKGYEGFPGSLCISVNDAVVHGIPGNYELRDGDIVQIQPQTETEPHDFTLIKIDGETATIKFVEITAHGVWIRALNKEVFEDRFYSIQEVMTMPITIIGKVVGMQRKF